MRFYSLHELQTTLRVLIVCHFEIGSSFLMQNPTSIMLGMRKEVKQLQGFSTAILRRRVGKRGKRVLVNDKFLVLGLFPML
jgi:hypothetical protein